MGDGLNQVEEIVRAPIRVPLSGDPADVRRRLGAFGDFSKINRTWNQSRSDTLHQRLEAAPEQWAHYHTLYREARKSWEVVPYEEMTRWLEAREGKIVGDFGCGEALISKAASGRHEVHSFDHVAINDDVTAGDMSHTPLDSETLDVAIFCLSLMGANFTDYLREAYRTLKIDGFLHIWEAESRFSDPDQFAKDLGQLGFEVHAVERRGSFIHIRAMKTEREAEDAAVLRF